jgi:hypothetical protein
MIYQDDVELNLALLLADGEEDFSDVETAEMGLHLMQCVAIKAAGEEHLVHWEASEALH